MRQSKSAILDYLETLVLAEGRMLTRREYEEIEDPDFPHVDVRDTLGSWNKTKTAVATRVDFDSDWVVIPEGE